MAFEPITSSISQIQKCNSRKKFSLNEKTVKFNFYHQARWIMSPNLLAFISQIYKNVISRKKNQVFQIDLWNIKRKVSSDSEKVKGLK